MVSHPSKINTNNDNANDDGHDGDIDCVNNNAILALSAHHEQQSLKLEAMQFLRLSVDKLNGNGTVDADNGNDNDTTITINATITITILTTRTITITTFSTTETTTTSPLLHLLFVFSYFATTASTT